MKLIDAIKSNYVNILFYVGAAILIGLLKGPEVVVLLTLFILLFGLISSTMVSGYNTFRGIKDKQLPLTAIGALVVSCIIYLGFGKQAFVKTLSYSLAVATILALLVVYFQIKSGKNP